ncbi:MAG: DNA methyltransferase [Isosphaeraceae bacterium]
MSILWSFTETWIAQRWELNPGANFSDTEDLDDLRYCKMLNRECHPARFPADLPRFFIQFLTEPGDLVLDSFG